MDEDQLRKMIERMVRDALSGRNVELSGNEDSALEDSDGPRHNYSMGLNSKRIIAANWKMNMTMEEAREFARGMRGFDIGDREVLVCSPIYIAPILSKALVGTGIRIGAQNMHHEPKGAFTGETSPLMLVDLGVSYVIIGHSERRHVLGESDDFISRVFVKSSDEEQMSSTRLQAVHKERFGEVLRGPRPELIVRAFVVAPHQGIKLVRNLVPGKRIDSNACFRDRTAFASYVPSLIFRESGQIIVERSIYRVYPFKTLVKPSRIAVFIKD